MTVLVARWPSMTKSALTSPEPDVEVDPAAGIVPWVLGHPAAGVYEVDRTYPGLRILEFDAHLDRLEASARREGMALAIDRPRLRAVLRGLVRRALGDEQDVGDEQALGDEATLGDGAVLASEAELGSVRFLVRAPFGRPDELEIVIEPFRPPDPALYVSGVVCATMAGARRAHPEAKTSAWMTDRTAFALPTGTYEGLLVSADDEILEGATSNFYAIVGGELRTAGAGVLPGIARRIVLAVAPGILPVRLEPVRRDELARVEEAFLTSSSRAVLPIAEIDGLAIGGRGPLTERIASAYDAWVETHLVLL